MPGSLSAMGLWSVTRIAGRNTSASGKACHGWFNRFRKLLVRYEKLEHTFLALNHLAATIITLRKIELPVNIIYG